MNARRIWQRVRNWRRGRAQVPTDLSDAVREGIGPRVVEGPAGLTTELFDTVLDDASTKGGA